jgi:DNA-binding transcriptional MerR regulator
VAEFLGVPVTTLHRWRYEGIGPHAFRVGRHLRYDPDVVRRWLVEDCARSA